MIDNQIAEYIKEITEKVDAINLIMAELYTKNVEVRIAYKDREQDNPPRLDLWRATEHVDYLQR